jgi:hypothetical protein
MGVHIYQIVYSEESKALCDPGFGQLDNLSNERPDWREYWPIRKFLGSHELDEGSFYGFLSPKFRGKTGLSSDTVLEFIGRNEATRDVFLFSPFFDQLAFFPNVFYQGDAAHAGLLKLSIDFLRGSGFDGDLSTMISCSRNAVFSNYIVARPSFWRKWFDATERLFRAAEDRSHPLHVRLNAKASYVGIDVEYKIFVLERIATYVLQGYALERIKAYPLQTSLGDSKIAERFFPELMILDSMKYCYLESGSKLYLELYLAMKQRVESMLAAG